MYLKFTLLLLAVWIGACQADSTPDSRPKTPEPKLQLIQIQAKPEPPPPSPTFVGLSHRPVSTRCQAPSRPPAKTELALEPMFGERTFDSVVDMVQSPSDRAFWYVMERTGRIWKTHESGTPDPELFVDISDQNVRSVPHGGLLGFAFSPNYSADRRVYLFYTPRLRNKKVVSRLVRLTVSEETGAVDRSSEEILFELPQRSNMHKGGHLEFGSDGYLYVGLGEDVHSEGAAQKLSSLMGKMLRLDVSTDTSYTSPPDNPLVGVANATPEVYAWGLRNPWRFSFDRKTDELWLADVGLDSFEEINIIESGKEYGWPALEGLRCHKPLFGCGRAKKHQNRVHPVYMYGRRHGGTVIGGYVYRGNAITALYGAYIFTDYVSGTIWSLRRNNDAVKVTPMMETSRHFSALAQDHEGELYLMDYGGMRGGLKSRVLKLVSTTEPIETGPGPAQQLSETGCFNLNDPWIPDEGFIPYTINAPFWSDGAVKRRWLMVPPETSIAINAKGDWELPIGSIAIKDFQLNNIRVETRLLVRHNDGGWAGYTYAWNDAQTDATLVDEPYTRTVGTQTWSFPSRSQCLQCHTEASGRTLGLETAQLNTTHHYTDTDTHANQLQALASVGILPLKEVDPALLPALVSPHGSGSVAQRARSYLHVNCSHCHRPEHLDFLEMDLRATTALKDTGLCNTKLQAPKRGWLGRVVPTLPIRSAVWQRMRHTRSRMPPLGTTQIDTQGAQLIHDWIAALKTCP